MITRKRDLKSGKTAWTRKPPRTLRSVRPDQDVVYDAVIIGCGVSGALAAEQVSRVPGRYLVVDRRPPASGSTSASTALIQWEIDEPLTALKKKIGPRQAAQAYRASYAGVQQLMARIRRLDIDCDLVRRDTLLLAGDTMGPKALRSESAARAKLGLPSTYVDGKDLHRRVGFPGDGAIRSRGSCELDPVKMTHGMLLAAQGRGFEVSWPFDVVDMQATPHGVFLASAEGVVVTARKVIAATGYEALPQIPSSNFDLVSTWALATKPVPEDLLWPTRALVWEASEPYLYFRTTTDNRIIVGGEDATFTDPRRRDALIRAKSHRILKKLSVMLPDVDLEPAISWAGTFAESPTGLPVIGEVRECPNVFAILGAGGNGITFSAIASDMAASWCQDRRHPLSGVFGPV